VFLASQLKQVGLALSLSNGDFEGLAG